MTDRLAGEDDLMESIGKTGHVAVAITPADAARTLRILWLSSVSSVFIFCSPFIVERPDARAIASSRIAAVAIVAAILSACATFRVRERAIRRESCAGPSPDPCSLEWIGRFQEACIFTWAWCWGVGLSGLVLGWLAVDFRTFLPFGVVALALHVKHRPTSWPQWQVLVSAASSVVRAGRPAGGSVRDHR